MDDLGADGRIQTRVEDAFGKNDRGSNVGTRRSQCSAHDDVKTNKEPSNRHGMAFKRSI